MEMKTFYEATQHRNPESSILLNVLSYILQAAKYMFMWIGSDRNVLREGNIS